jgi:hypothetical protein
LVQLSPDLDLTWTYFDLSNASTINYTQTQLSATIQFNRISSVLDGSFVASNPTVLIDGVTNAGKVALFKNFIETDVVYGDVNTTLLGEYIWLSYDGLPGQSQQPIIAASYYLSPTTRSINLYKVLEGDFNL